MLKFIRWLAKLAFGTIVVTGLSVIITWSMVSAYVDHIFKEMNLAINSNVGLGEVISAAAMQIERLTSSNDKNGRHLAEAEPKEEDSGTANEVGSLNPNEPREQRFYPDERFNSEAGKDSSGAANEDSQSEDPFNEEALEVWSQGGLEQTERQEVILSPEDFNMKKDQISSEDKMEIFSVLMAKVPTSEIQRMSLFLEEGITHEEMQQIHDIVHAYLAQDEVSKLNRILEKYE